MGHLANNKLGKNSIWNSCNKDFASECKYKTKKGKTNLAKQRKEEEIYHPYKLVRIQ